jgi:branched-chain amino acid transport system permease protein
MMSLDAFSALLVSGLVLGSIYAMMASGLSLVWTTLGIFNFAHGVFMALGAYVAWTVSDAAGLNLWLGFAIAMSVAVMAGLGILIERTVVRPFYGQRDMLLITVMTTLAVMMFLEKGIQMLWGPRLKQLRPIVEGKVSLLGITISAQEAFIIVIAPLVLAALWAFLRWTSTGRGIRAVGQNPDAAKLIGINASAMFAVTFALSAVLAGFTGILLGSLRLLTPGLGAEPLIKAFIIVIFGGMGSLAGTIGAAYIIGLFEAFLITTVGFYWAPSALFLILIAVLLVRPEGLFGRRVA